jgi:hypothetical protein
MQTIIKAVIASTLFSAVLECAIFALPLTANAQVIYHVTADTSAINGTAGNLDFQFNPGGPDALAAQVNVTNVFTDGAAGAGVVTTGDVSGTVFGAGGATLRNTAFFNDIFQEFTYGSNLSFDVTLSGPALTPSMPFPAAGSEFAFSLYDAAGTTPLLTSDVGGAVLTLDIAPDGTTSATTFLTDAGGPPVVSATVSAVPEVGPGWSLAALLTVGGAALELRRRKRRGMANGSAAS